MNRLLKIGIAATALLLIAWTAYRYGNYRIGNMQDRSVTSQLSEIMILPEGKPTIATVVDASKLKQKDIFYKHAENGDKVVIWKERAVIYRPSTRKIVDFGIVVQ